jgi:hypothetical protein
MKLKFIEFYSFRCVFNKKSLTFESWRSLEYFMSCINLSESAQNCVKRASLVEHIHGKINITKKLSFTLSLRDRESTQKRDIQEEGEQAESEREMKNVNIQEKSQVTIELIS